jgi:excisionase family DNA binding protein
MSNLIPLEQAAKMLGLAPERVVEMISKKQIYGYRDGNSWKFKAQEIERVADELGLELPNLSDEDDAFSLSDSSINDDLILDDSSSEDEDFELSDDLDSLAPVAKSAKPAPKKPVADDDSSVDLSDSSDLILQDSGDDLKLEAKGKGKGKGKESAKSAVGEEDDLLLFGDSSLELAAESSKKIKKPDSGVHDSDLLLSDDPSGSTGKLLKAMKDRVGDSKDEISLSEDELFDDDLKLGDSDSLEDSIDLGSDYEDSDIVLDDSDSSSELVLETNEKGISLSPNDSGIQLADSLQLGGSDIDELELPDDDMVSLNEAADADAATFLQEDDFNLTPFEDKEADDASGSQVIALEDSDLFASDSESTLLNDKDMEAQPQLVSEGLTPSGSVPAQVVVGSPELPFTLWQVLSLGLTASILVIGLPVIFDTARNLWMPSDQVTHEGLLNTILSLTGMK